VKPRLTGARGFFREAGLAKREAMTRPWAANRQKLGATSGVRDLDQASMRDGRR
jgi:hypothetical protein